MRGPCIYTGTEDYLQPVSATLWVTAMQDESTTLDSFGSYMLFTILASLIAWGNRQVAKVGELSSRTTQ